MVPFSLNAAFLNVFIVHRFFQRKVCRATGSLTTLVATIVFLNIAAIGALLLVYSSQTFVSNNWTGACVRGPTVAYFCVSLSITPQATLSVVAFLRRFLRCRYSNKQVILICAVAIFASCLLLSPAIWFAAKSTPVITTVQCVDGAVVINEEDEIHYRRIIYVKLLLISESTITGFIIITAFVWMETMFYFMAVNMFGNNKVSIYATIPTFLAFVIANFSALALLNLALEDLSYKWEMTGLILMSPEISFLTEVCPAYVVVNCLIWLESTKGNI